MEQRFVVRTLEQTGKERREECVAGTSGVSHVDVESRMLDPSSVAPERGAVSPSRDAHRSAMKPLDESGDALAKVPAEIEPRGEATHLVIGQLHDVRTPETVADDLTVVIRRAKVHAQHLERACLEDAAHRGTRHRVPLTERAEDDRLGCRCTLEERACDLEVVPGGRLDDVVRRAAIRGDRDPNESGGEQRVDLQQVRADAVACDSPIRLVAKLVRSDARDHRGDDACRRQLTRDVEWRAAEKQSCWRGVPEQLPDAEDLGARLRWRGDRHILILLGMISGAPDPSGLSGRTVSHFRVLEPLGSGGMGVVYRGEDVTLGRTVALKFMLPDYTMDDTAEARFLREARSVAALDHPNICTVHEAGTSADGLLFLAMSYYPGETLKDCLTRHGSLPIDRALDIAAQVARGLACAHGAGFVHRDLKPANVMLTSDGTVKILDFGLAKSRDQTLTASGTVMGTVAYMAPEQLLGDQADTRTDLYSVGVVLYEMLTGQHPSRGDDISGTLTREIEARHPVPLHPAVTTSVRQLVERALRRDPEQRYQSADELLADLTTLRRFIAAASAPSASVGTPRPARSGRRTWLALGGVGVALLASSVGVTWWRQRAGDPAGTGTVATPRAAVSLAVLPLKNYSGPDQDYFVDGMTDELTTTLTKIEAMRVIAHQSVLQFKQSTQPAPDIARTLNVEYLVDGSVRQDSTRVIVVASLVDAARNTPLWSDTFERGRSDVMALQREVALAITQAIQVRLTPQDQTRLAPTREPDPEALEDYLRGTQARFDANTTGEFDKAIPFLNAAVAKDSSYAAAYAGLASVYGSMGDENKARAFADKALALDPKLAEAHMVRGMVLQYFDWDMAGAEREFREALRQNPGFAEGHHELSMLLNRLKKFDEALREGRKAVDLNPISLRFMNGVAEVQIYNGGEREALATAARLLATDSTFANAYMVQGIAYEVLEEWDNAIEAWTDCNRVLPVCDESRARIGYAYGRSGRTDEARKVLRALLARVNEPDRSHTRPPSAPHQGDLAVDLAVVYLGLGDRAQALTWLERATDARSGYMLYLAADPIYKPLHEEPRFRVLLKRLNLPA